MAQFYALNAAGNFHLRGKLFRSRWTAHKSICGKQSQGQFSDSSRGHVLCEVGLKILLIYWTMPWVWSEVQEIRNHLIHKRRIYLIRKINKTTTRNTSSGFMRRGRETNFHFCVVLVMSTGVIFRTVSYLVWSRTSIPRLRNKKCSVRENWAAPFVLPLLRDVWLIRQMNNRLRKWLHMSRVL
jgi:hypothetical protein